MGSVRVGCWLARVRSGCSWPAARWLAVWAAVDWLLVFPAQAVRGPHLVGVRRRYLVLGVAVVAPANPRVRCPFRRLAVATWVAGAAVSDHGPTLHPARRTKVPRPPADGAANWVFADETGSEAPSEDSAGNLDAGIDRARLVNSSLSFIDAMTDNNYALTELNARASMKSLDKPLSFDGSGMLNGETFDLDLDLTSISAVAAGETASANLTLKLISAKSRMMVRFFCLTYPASMAGLMLRLTT